MKSQEARQAFGARLRAAREALGLSQEKFARLVGVRRVAQFLYETGERSPTADYLMNARQIGVDVGHLLIGDPVPSPTAESSGLNAEQIGALYRAVNSLAVDRFGAPLPIEKRAETVEAVCRVLLASGSPRGGRRFENELRRLVLALSS